MAKLKQAEISVVTILDGKQDGREVFIDLILHKKSERARGKNNLDFYQVVPHNGDKVFSDVRVL